VSSKTFSLLARDASDEGHGRACSDEVLTGSSFAQKAANHRPLLRTEGGGGTFGSGLSEHRDIGVSAGPVKVESRPPMAVVEPIGAPIDSAEAWSGLMAWLPAMLTQLLASEVFNAGCRPPQDQRGIYLFSEGSQHLYVGRTGITAHSRAKGGAPITSFRHRFDQHTQPGRPPGASSFANRLMLERAAECDLVVPGDWWARSEDDGLGDLRPVQGIEDPNRPGHAVPRRAVRGRHQRHPVYGRRGLRACASEDDLQRSFDLVSGLS
jgi:hypothetical protein